MNFWPPLMDHRQASGYYYVGNYVTVHGVAHIIDRKKCVSPLPCPSLAVSGVPFPSSLRMSALREVLYGIDEAVDFAELSVLRGGLL